MMTMTGCARGSERSRWVLSGLAWVMGALLFTGCAGTSVEDDEDAEPLLLQGKTPDEKRLADLREPNRERLFLELDRAIKTWRTLAQEPGTRASLEGFLSDYVLANRGAILAALESDVVRERAIASGSLYFLQDPVIVEPLSDLLDDSSSLVVGNALMALATVADERVAEGRVAELSRSEDKEVRQNAVLVLGKIVERRGPADVPVDALVAALEDPEPAVRFNAVKGLSHAKDPRVGPAVIKLLKDPWPGIRAHAALTLGAVGEPGAAEALRPLLEDESQLVRDAAENALDALGGVARP